MQCKVIADVASAIVVLKGSDGDGQHYAACWPQNIAAGTNLVATVDAAMASGRPVIRTGVTTDTAQQSHDFLACPVLVDGQLAGVVAFQVTSRPAEQLAGVMQLLKLGTAWLDFLARQQTNAVQSGLVTVVEVLATSLRHSDFAAAGRAVVSELAARLECDYVCLGSQTRNHVRLDAISNAAQFEAKARLARAVENAMDEALDQRCTVVLPVATGAPVRITRAHESMLAQCGAGAVCTVPLICDEKLAGAISFLRPADRPFEAHTVVLCEQIAAVVGPVLELKRRDARSGLQQIRHNSYQWLARLLGPRHLWLKFNSAALLAVLAILLMAQGTYRVRASATLEGSVQRAVVAPISGYIVEAKSRPGDVVKKGDLLGRLDGKDLELQAVALTNQRSQFERQYRGALAEHDRVQARILKAQTDQVQAQLALVDEQLSRVNLLAPFDGIILAGDLSQSLGSPVERGQVLFQVAPLDAYRVMLKVDERDIAELVPGLSGKLVLTALPGKELALHVVRITPVSSPQDGANVFEVEAALAQAPDVLRPGMAGLAKVDIGERRLIHIGTRNLVNRVRLWLWSWW